MITHTIKSLLSTIVLCILTVNIQAQELTELIPTLNKSILTVRYADKPLHVRGTAFVIDSRGYLITNNHVVGKNTTVKVAFEGNKLIDAKVYITDPNVDLAILKISTDSVLTPLKLELNNKLGQSVVIIGHPFNYLYSISTGIISGNNRLLEVPNGKIINKCLQTTAAINKGNSGGPCCNLDGKVLGIVMATQDKSQNIGFIISATTINDFLYSRLYTVKK